MTQTELIAALEPEWDEPNGFFAKLRIGRYDAKHASTVLGAIAAADLGNGPLERRLVSLLWYLPTFCAWQEERVHENGGDVDALRAFATELTNALEEKLGVP